MNLRVDEKAHIFDLMVEFKANVDDYAVIYWVKNRRHTTISTGDNDNYLTAIMRFAKQVDPDYNWSK